MTLELAPCTTRSPAPILFVSGVLLTGLLGCSGVLYRTPDTVKADVEAHLQQVYGEPFEVTRVNNQSDEGVGIVDRHGYQAHPKRSPDTTIRGLADYDADPSRITDDYRCVRALPALRKRYDDALRARGLWSEKPYLRCRNDALPVHPDPDALVPEAFRATGDLQSFADGDPLELATQLEGELQALGAEAGLSVEPGSYHFLLPQLAPLLPHLSHDDQLVAYERGYARYWKDAWHHGTSRPLEAAGTEAEEALQPEAPGPLEVRAWPMNSEAHDAWKANPEVRRAELPEGARMKLDVRVAAPSTFDEAGATAFVDRVRKHLFPHTVSVHIGRYTDAGAPSPESYQGGWVCRGFQLECQAVEGYLVGPDAL